MKVLIAIPCYKTISVKTTFSLIDLIQNTEHEVKVVFQEGVFVHENQNNLAECAVREGFDYLFFVEHDMIFEPETLDKLIKDNKDIICANYNYRSEPRCSMTFKRNENGVLENIPYKEIPKETFECEAIPTGLTLIRTDVFKKLKQPYFFYNYNDKGQMETSQDVYFCLKAKEAGFKIWCNPLIVTAHQGETLY